MLRLCSQHQISWNLSIFRRQTFPRETRISLFFPGCFLCVVKDQDAVPSQEEEEDAKNNPVFRYTVCIPLLHNTRATQDGALLVNKNTRIGFLRRRKTIHETYPPAAVAI